MHLMQLHNEPKLEEVGGAQTPTLFQTALSDSKVAITTDLNTLEGECCRNSPSLQLRGHAGHGGNCFQVKFVSALWGCAF